MNRKKNIYLISIFIILFSLLITSQKKFSLNSFGKKIICFYLEKKLNSKVHFNTVSISLFGKQKVTNIEIQNQYYTFLGKNVSINQSIFSLLTHFYIKNINIENFYFKIKEIEKEKKLNKNKKNIINFFSKIETINLINGTITLQNINDLKENSFQEVFFSKSENKISSSGKILNPNNQGHFFINITMQPLINVSINILNFPLYLFFNSEKKINSNDTHEYIDLTFSTQQNILEGNIQSKNIEGFIQGHIEDNSLILNEKTSYLILKNKFFINFLNKKFNNYIKINNENLEIYSYIKEGIFNFKNIKNSTFTIINEIKLLELSTENNKTFYIKNIKIKNTKSKSLSYSSFVKGTINYKNLNSSFNISITNLFSLEKEKNILINEFSISESLINEFLPVYIKEITSSLDIINITGKLNFLKKLSCGNIDLKSKNLSAKITISHKLCNYKTTLSGFYIPPKDFFSYIHNIPKIKFNICGDLEENNIYFSNFLGKIFSDNFFINIKTKICPYNKKITTNDIFFSLQGKFDGVLFKIHSLPLLNIDNGYFDLCFNGKHNNLLGSSLLNIDVIDSNKNSSSFLLSLEKISINNFFSRGKINYHDFQSSFNGNIKNFSLETLESTGLISFPIPSIIDKNFFISFSGNIDEKSNNFLSLESKISNQNLNISNQWNFNQSLETIPSSKSYIELIITPKNYENIINKTSIKPDCLLDENILITAELYPFYNPYKKQIKGSFFCKSITFKSNSTKEKILINDTNGELKVNLEENFLEYRLKGIRDKNSFIELEGIINKPPHDSPIYKGNAIIKSFPSFFSFGILPIPLSLKESLEQLSGKIMTQLFTWNLQNHNGTLFYNFNSPNIKAEIPLEIHNKFISLSDTVKLHLLLNKTFIDIISKDFNFFTIQENKSLPISLTIEKSNVFIPIHPYDFKDVTINSAHLDIGKIQIIKNDKLKQLLDFLKMQNQASLMEAWITPIYFNLKNGILSYKRFDLLINKVIHLAFWGKTNLLNNYVNLTLGIEPFTLEKILKINNLPKNGFFLVKIYGPIDNPSIDWSSAYSRLGILSAAASGGHLGNLFGNVLDKFLSTLGGQTPPPTTKPFPWEENK